MYFTPAAAKKTSGTTNCKIVKEIKLLGTNNKIKFFLYFRHVTRPKGKIITITGIALHLKNENVRANLRCIQKSEHLRYFLSN